MTILTLLYLKFVLYFFILVIFKHIKLCLDRNTNARKNIIVHITN